VLVLCTKVILSLGKSTKTVATRPTFWLKLHQIGLFLDCTGVAALPRFPIYSWFWPQGRERGMREGKRRGGKGSKKIKVK